MKKKGVLSDFFEEEFPIVVEFDSVIQYNNYHLPNTVVVLTSKNNYDNKYSYYAYSSQRSDETFLDSGCNILNNSPCTLFTGKDSKKILKDKKNHLKKNFENALNYGGIIGADPEIFLENKKGETIPAWEFLGSKKEKKNPTLNGRHAYWDGFQSEFDVEPRRCLQELSREIKNSLNALKSYANKYDKDAKFTAKPTVDVDRKILTTAKDEHINFGCMPSLNVYQLKGLPLPGREVDFRSSGGHIHFGIGKLTNDRAKRIMKSLDAILGVACVSLFDKYDDPKRRLLYGLAGEYRLPEHGLEYRTLSNVWMYHPVLMHIVFDLARKALVLGDKDLLDVWKYDEKEVIKIIQTHDVKVARKMLEANEKVFKRILYTIYWNDAKVDIVYNAFMNGADSIISDMKNIEKNWDLSSGSGNLPSDLSSVVSTLIDKRKV